MRDRVDPGASERDLNTSRAKRSPSRPVAFKDGLPVEAREGMPRFGSRGLSGCGQALRASAPLRDGREKRRESFGHDRVRLLATRSTGASPIPATSVRRGAEQIAG